MRSSGGLTPSCPPVVVQVLPGKRRRQRLRALRRDRPEGRGQPVEPRVLPGGGRQREAPGAAVAVETQGRLLQALRNPAEGERGGAGLKGPGHRHGR